MPVASLEALATDRIEALRSFHRAAGQANAEIDVSGGVDSALLCTLLVQALGKSRVTAVFIDINSSPASRERALAVAQACGVRLIIDDVSAEFERRIALMLDRLGQAGYDRAAAEARLARDPLILGSIRSCLRAPIGRGYNRLTGGGIRHGTGNECEDRFLRFFQKGGDGEVDTNPIEMLAKGEVYQLARHVGVPTVVLDAEPTPDLWGAGAQHTDERELVRWSGVAWTYSHIDAASGCYTRVGTIERMNRYLDAVNDALFADDAPSIDDFVHGRGMPAALGHPAFRGQSGDMSEPEVNALLTSASRLERATRHKQNPNVPALGHRRDLLDRGILTNDLPLL
jgi:NAD+ synthetase